MYKKNLIMAMLCIALCSFMQIIAQPTPENSEPYVKGEIIVKFKTTSNKQAVATMLLSDQKSVYNSRKAFPGIPDKAQLFARQTQIMDQLQKENSKYEEQLQQIQSKWPRFLYNKQQEELYQKIAGINQAISHQKQLKEKIEMRLRRAEKDINPHLENIYIIKTHPDSTLSTLKYYQSRTDVEYAELNFNILGSAIPNEPAWQENYPGQSYKKLYGYELMDLEQAWDITSGRSNVIIAPIETGIDIQHEDLADNIWVNHGEIAGNNIDDDGNGYIDDYHGMFFYADGVTSSPVIPADNHGTHVSGTVAAKGNNNTGIMGVTWNCLIMPSTGASTLGRANAILYAAQNGADVITNSWYGIYFSNVLQDVINYAYSLGSVITTSAGNRNSDASSQLPANYENTITVAASDVNDIKAVFSNYGAKVDVTAPGVNIYSTIPGNQYGFLSGTSMSTPHVAGLAALILSHNLDKHEQDTTTYPLLTNEEIRQVIRKSADDIIDPLGTGMNLPGFDIYSGFGRVNAYSALQYMDEHKVCLANITGPKTNLVIGNDDFVQGRPYHNGWTIVSGTINIEGMAYGEGFNHYTIEYSENKQVLQWTHLFTGNTLVTGNAPDNILYQGFNTNNLNNGSYLVKLTVFNNAGESFEDYLKIDVMRALITNIPNKNEEMGKEPVFTYGPYDIRGLAYGPGFTGYHMEYGMGENPSAWTVASSVITTPVNLTSNNSNGGGLLFDKFNFGALPEGILTLKLVVEDAIIGTQEYSIVIKNDGSHYPLHTGFPVYEHSEHLSYCSPVTADLDGDGKKEIIVAGFNYLSAYNSEGVALFRTYFNLFTTSAPAIANITGDERPEIAIKGSLNSSQGYKEYIKLFNYNGTPVSGWNEPSYSVNGLSSNMINFGYSSVALADLDNDGYQEMIFGVADGSNGRVYAYNGDGTAVPGWEGGIPTSGPVNHTPVVGDIDNDRQGYEVVVKDINNQICAIGPTGTILWQTPSKGLADDYSDMLILADLDNNGTLEIISTIYQNPGVAVWDYAGNLLWYKEHQSIVVGTSYYIAVADINKDGYLEIVETLYKQNSTNDGRGEHFCIYKNDGTILNQWQVPGNSFALKGFLLANVNDDANLEIIAPASDKADNQIFAFDINGQQLQDQRWPIRKDGYSNSNLIFDDIDNNGTAEIIFNANNGSLRVWDLPVTFEPEKGWYLHFNNSRNTGVAASAYSTVLDTTPPSKPSVTDEGEFKMGLTELNFSWQSTDNETPIAEYLYSLGTAPDSTNVIAWTSNGTNSSLTLTNLSLTVSTTYFLNVKAINSALLESETGTSDGITILEDSLLWDEDFEDNNTTGWNLNNANIASDGANATGLSLKILKNGTASATLNYFQPEYISFFAKASTNNNYALICLGFWNSQATMAAINFNPSGTIAVDAGSYINLGNVNTDTWYHFELKNINWTSRTFDLYLNNNLIQANVAFKINDGGPLTSLYIRNYLTAGNGTISIDEIVMAGRIASDREQPTLTNVLPANLSVLNSPVTISGTANDNVGLNKLKIAIYQQQENSGSYTFYRYVTLNLDSANAKNWEDTIHFSKSARYWLVLHVNDLTGNNSYLKMIYYDVVVNTIPPDNILLSDDFEQGHVSPVVLNSYSVIDSTTGANQTPTSLKLNKSGTGTYQCDYFMPESILFYAKASSALTNSYIIIGNDSYSYLARIQFNSQGTIAVLAGSYVNVGTYSGNTWYKVELRNMNWAAKTFDVFINDVEVSTNVLFDRNEAIPVQTIRVMNIGTEENSFWIDEIMITGTKAGDNEPQLIINNSMAVIDGNFKTGN